MTDLAAEAEATAMVAVPSDPARRLELAARFYDRRAGGRHPVLPRPTGVYALADSTRGPGRAECGPAREPVMSSRQRRPNPRCLAGPPAGQPTTWNGESAQRGVLGPVPAPASAEGWYRARDASIVAGYLEQRDLSRQELP